MIENESNINSGPEQLGFISPEPLGFDEIDYEIDRGDSLDPLRKKIAGKKTITLRVKPEGIVEKIAGNVNEINFGKERGRQAPIKQKVSQKEILGQGENASILTSFEQYEKSIEILVSRLKELKKEIIAQGPTQENLAKKQKEIDRLTLLLESKKNEELEKLKKEEMEKWKRQEQELDEKLAELYLEEQKNQEATSKVPVMVGAVEPITGDRKEMNEKKGTIWAAGKTGGVVGAATVGLVGGALLTAWRGFKGFMVDAYQEFTRATGFDAGEWKKWWGRWNPNEK